MFADRLNLGLPGRAQVVKTIHGMEIHFVSAEEKVINQSSETGKNQSLLITLNKGTKVNKATYCQLLREYSLVALCGWAAKADDSFVCFGAKPDKGFLDQKSRRIRKWEGDANESWLDKGAESIWWRDSKESWRGTTDRGSQHRTPETSGRQDGVQRRGRVALWNFR